MESKMHLRKPSNWSDFEDLCKRLWGEIWKCPEIKKNGRNGQEQHGVDVYGVPAGESDYYGIQCKGKDDYTEANLTEKEIDKEINKAKKFLPPLKKLYFATTANKDSRIEQYVRIKDHEHRKNGLFSIDLFCWEDIVDLIDRSKETHDWYLNNQKFKLASSVSISFENEQKTLNLKVPFAHIYTHYVQRIIPAYGFVSPSDMINYEAIYGRGRNLSYAPFKIRLFNDGIKPIENSKLKIRFAGVFESIHNDNEDMRFGVHVLSTDIHADKGNSQIEVIPRRTTIVPGEEYVSDTIYVKPLRVGSQLVLTCDFISNDYRSSTILHLNIETTTVSVYKKSLVDLSNQVRVEETAEDYFDSYDEQ